MIIRAQLKVVVEGMGACLVFPCRPLRVPGTLFYSAPNLGVLFQRRSAVRNIILR
jgi:hypothetical protein